MIIQSSCAEAQKFFRTGNRPQPMPNNIDLLSGNVSHARMKSLNQTLFLTKLAFTAFVLLFMTLQAGAQQADANRHTPRGQRPHNAGKADVRVWVGVDVFAAGTAIQDSSANSRALLLQQQRAQFAGVWTSQALPGLVLTLNPDGDFSLTLPGNRQRRCAAGVERGSWIASTEPGELQFHIKTDTSGQCGLSDLALTMAVVTTETGLILIIDDPSADEQKIPLTRAEP